MTIYGDGETSRDFCFVANAVQANLRAAMTTDAAALNEVYNVAVGERTTLNGLFETLAGLVRDRNAGLEIPGPAYEAFRVGDVRHSQADIGKARRLGYAPPTICAPGCRRRCPGISRAICQSPANPERRAGRIRQRDVTRSTGEEVTRVA